MIFTEKEKLNVSLREYIGKSISNIEFCGDLCIDNEHYAENLYNHSCRGLMDGWKMKVAEDDIPDDLERSMNFRGDNKVKISFSDISYITLTFVDWGSFEIDTDGADEVISDFNLSALCGDYIGTVLSDILIEPIEKETYEDEASNGEIRVVSLVLDNHMMIYFSSGTIAFFKDENKKNIKTITIKDFKNCYDKYSSLFEKKYSSELKGDIWRKLPGEGDDRMMALRKALCNVKDAYPDFVDGVVIEVVKNPEIYDSVMEYANQPEITTSEIIESLHPVV